ncbi:MAG: hypothetical protein LBD89_04150, partial [Tannerellaceae bacterium]|nr:hypothetical protein [Tannerellaceae bacterium]
LDTLETLFPKAGWDKIDEYPDFFPYFSSIFDLGKNYALMGGPAPRPHRPRAHPPAPQSNPAHARGAGKEFLS